MDYKKLYFMLLDATSKIIDQLIEVSQEAERLYIEHEEIPVELIKTDGMVPNPKD